METYCIISDQKKVVSETNIEEIKAAVFVNLFYVEQLQIYQNYLEQVPDFIDIVIISPKEHILKCFRGNRFITIRKENRGRDISALLVAANFSL